MIQHEECGVEPIITSATASPFFLF